MNQSEFLEITCKLLDAWEKSREKVRLVLVLLLFGLKTGAKLLN